MVEDKGMVSYDDACSRSSNEEDSLLSTGSSPNMTSPSSTSALSGSGSSVDEGVDMTDDADACKRILFGSKMGKHMPDPQDQPIDLSMKKQKNGVQNPTRNKKQNPKPATHKLHSLAPRRESSELVIVERMSPQSAFKSNKPAPGLGSKGNSPSNSPPVSEIPRSLAPTYLPWSYTRPATLPFTSANLHNLWHPALLMSHTARHLNPGLLPLASTSGTTAVFPTQADPMQHIYSQNVLAEFSRICSQAKHLYGNHVLPEQISSVGGVKLSPPSAKQPVHPRPRNDKFNHNTKQENGVRIKQEVISEQDFGESRKRKLDDNFPESYRSAAEKFSLVPLGKRIRVEYKAGVFDHGMDEADSPPTMVPNLYSNQNQHQIENGRVVPKPVDFKPCRFPCNECGRTYATVGGLLKHSKTHHDPENNNSFKCKTCDKEYNSLGALKMHIRTHTLPCKCHICGKAFSRTWLLQGHIRTHTGEKPYQCSVCSRAFADRSNLRAHMQTHESVKRYACTSCDKTFSRISLLNRHRVSGCIATS